MAKDFNCRGKERRIEIVRIYHIEPFRHLRLLNGQTKQSCAGPICEDRYYIFEYKNKTDENENGVFNCGYTVAEHFLELINHPPLPVFNPLQVENDGNVGESGGGNNQNNQIEMDSLNRELYNALNLLFICWDLEKLYGVLKDISVYLHDKPNVRTKNWAVLAFNNILGNQNSCLEEMVDELREMGNKVRDFRFDRMNEIIGRENNHIGFYK